MVEFLVLARDLIKSEWAHVKQYPIHFVLSVLVVSAFIWWVVDAKYEDDLERVRDVRDDYAVQLQNTNSKLDEIRPEFERLSALEEELDDLYARTHTKISRVKILMRFVVEGNDLFLWGAEMGYPAIVLDNDGEDVSGFIFSSENLIRHWAELDKFEGDEYERIITKINLGDHNSVDAYIYVLKKR